MPRMNLGKKARNVASITNRPTCGGPSKAGLAPSIGAAYTGLYMNASMRRAINKIDWPINCQDAIDAGMPLSKNPACSGGVGNIRSRRYCRCSKCSVPRGFCSPDPQLLPVSNLQAWYVLPVDKAEYDLRKFYKPYFTWLLPVIDQCAPPSSRHIHLTLLQWDPSKGIWAHVPNGSVDVFRYTNSTPLGWKNNPFPTLDVSERYRIWVTIYAHYENFAPQRAAVYVDFPPFGDGRTNPYPDVPPAHTVPGPPQDLVGGGWTRHSVQLKWEMPLNNGGELVTSYVVQMAEQVGGPFRTVLTNITTLSALVDTYNGAPLTSDATYYFKVAAVNAIGTGELSPPTAVKTAPEASPKPPTAPTDFAGVALTQAAYLSWGPPDDTGGFPLTQYQLRRTGGTGPAVEYLTIHPSEQRSPRAYYDSPLDSVPYTYEVCVQNSKSLWSPWATLPGTITPLPAPPPKPKPPDPPVWYGTLPVTGGAGTLRGQWTSPANPGSYPITQFTMQVSKSGDDWSAATSDILSASSFEYPYSDTIDGLTGVTKYYARVKAQSLDTQTGELLDSSWNEVKSATTSVSCTCPPAGPAPEWNGTIKLVQKLPATPTQSKEWGAKISWVVGPGTAKYRGCISDWKLEVYPEKADGLADLNNPLPGSGMVSSDNPLAFYILNSSDPVKTHNPALFVQGLQPKTTYWLYISPQPNTKMSSPCLNISQHPLTRKFTTGDATGPPPPTQPCTQDLTDRQVWVGTVRETPKSLEQSDIPVASCSVNWNDGQLAPKHDCVKTYDISIYDGEPSTASTLFNTSVTSPTNFTIAHDLTDSWGWIGQPTDSKSKIPLANVQTPLVPNKAYYLKIQPVQKTQGDRAPDAYVAPFQIGQGPSLIPEPPIPTGHPYYPQTYVTTYGIPSWGKTDLGSILGNSFFSACKPLIGGKTPPLLDASLNMIQSWAMVREWSREFFGQYINFIANNVEVTNAMLLVGDWLPVLPGAGTPVQASTEGEDASVSKKHGQVAGSNLDWDILKANYSYCAPNGPVDFGLPYSCPSLQANEPPASTGLASTGGEYSQQWRDAVQTAWHETDTNGECPWLGCPLILDFLLPLAERLRGQTDRIVGISVNGDVSKQGGDGAYYSLDCGNYAQQDLRITGADAPSTNLLALLGGGNNNYYKFPDNFPGKSATTPGAWGSGWYSNTGTEGNPGGRWPDYSMVKAHGFPVQPDTIAPKILGSSSQQNPDRGKIQTIRVAMSKQQFDSIGLNGSPDAVKKIVVSQNNAGGGFGTTTLFFDPSSNPLPSTTAGFNGLLSAKYVPADQSDLAFRTSVYKDTLGYAELVVEIQFRMVPKQGKAAAGAFTVTDTDAGSVAAAKVYFSTYTHDAPTPPVPWVDNGQPKPWTQPQPGDNPANVSFKCTYADPAVGNFAQYYVLQQNDPTGQWALPAGGGVATKEKPWGIVGQIATDGGTGSTANKDNFLEAASLVVVQLAPGVKPEWIQSYPSKSTPPDASLNTLDTPDPNPPYMKYPARTDPPVHPATADFPGQHRVYYIKVGQGAWDQTQPVPQPPVKGVPEGPSSVNKYTNYDKMWPLLLGGFGVPPEQKPPKTPFNYTTAPLSSSGVNAGSKARALWGGSDPSGTPNATPSTGGWLSPEWSTEYSQLACYPAYWNVAPQPQLLPMQPGGKEAEPGTFSDAGGLVMGGGNVFIGNGIGAYTGRGAYFDPSSVLQPNTDLSQPKTPLTTTPPSLVTLDKTGTGKNGTFFTYEGSEGASWSPENPATLDASGAIGFPLDNLHQQYILLYRINQKIMEFNWKCAQQAAGKGNYGIKAAWANPTNPLVIPYIGHVHHDKESYQVNKTPLYPVCDKTTGELSTAWLLGDDTGDESNVPDLISAIRSYSPEAYLIWKQNRRLAGVSYEKYLYNRYMPAEFLPDWRTGRNGPGPYPHHYLLHNSGCLIPCTGDRSSDGFSNMSGTGEVLWDIKNKPWNNDQQRNFGTEPSSYSCTDPSAQALPSEGAPYWDTLGGVGNYTNDLRSRMVRDLAAPTATKSDGIQRYPMGWVNYKVECWSHTVPFGQSAGPDASGASGATKSGPIFSKVTTTASVPATVKPDQLFFQDNTLASGTIFDVSDTTLKVCVKQGDFNDQEKIVVYTDPTPNPPTTVTLIPEKGSLKTPAEQYTSQGHNEAYQELYNIGEVKPPFASDYLYDAEPTRNLKTGNKPPPSPTITLKTSTGDLSAYMGGTVTYSGTPDISGNIVKVLDKKTLVLKKPVTYQPSGAAAKPAGQLGGEGTFPDKAQVTLKKKDGTGEINAYIGDSYWPTTNSPFPPEFLMIKTPPAQGMKQEYGTTYTQDNSAIIFELPPPPKAGSGAANYIPNKFGSACVPGETPPVCPTGKSVFCPKYPTQAGSAPTGSTPPWGAWNPTQFEDCSNKKDSDTTCYFNCPPTCPTTSSSACCAVGPYYKLNAVTNTLISRVYNKYTCDVNGYPSHEHPPDKNTLTGTIRASFLGRNAVVTTGSSPALSDIWLRADTNAKGQAILPLDGRGTYALDASMNISGQDYTYPKGGNSAPLSPSKKSATDGVYAPLQDPYVNLKNSQIDLSGMYGPNWPGMPTASSSSASSSSAFYTIPVPSGGPNGDFLPPQGPRQAIALFANEFIGGALTADPTARPGNTAVSEWSPSYYGVFKPKVDNSNNPVQPVTDVWPDGTNGQAPYLRKGPYGLVPGPVESWVGSRCMETLVYGHLTESFISEPSGKHPTVNSKLISPSWSGTGHPNKKGGTGASESPFTVIKWKIDITGEDPPAGKTAIGTLRENWNENGWSYDANGWGGEYNGLSSLQDKRDYAAGATSFTGYKLMREFLAACASMQAGIRDTSTGAGPGAIEQGSLHQARVGLYTIGFMPESWLKNGPS